MRAFTGAALLAAAVAGCAPLPGPTPTPTPTPQPTSACGDPTGIYKPGQPICDPAHGLRVTLTGMRITAGGGLPWQTGNISGGRPVAVTTYTIRNTGPALLDIQGVTLAVTWQGTAGPAQYVDTPGGISCRTYTLPAGSETTCGRGSALPLDQQPQPAAVAVHWWNHPGWPTFRWHTDTPPWSPSPRPSLIVEDGSGR